MAIDLSKIENFQDAAVTIMGLGRYKQGSGIGAAKWLLRHGAQLVITDLASEEDLRESVDEIMRWYTQYKNEFADRDIYPPIFVLGEHHDEDFVNVDMIVQNPAVRRESEYLALAKKEGIQIESDISLFFRYCPFPIISITGTRGKSTTTALLGEMMRHKHPKTVVAGNITRSPLEDLDWLLEEKEPVPVVLELSSWLLESLEGTGFGPQIAVLTNAYKDHLDRYDSFEHYLWAKELIFKEQKPDQVAIFNNDQEVMEEIAARSVSEHKYWVSMKPLPEGKRGAFLDGDALKYTDHEKEEVFASVSDVALEGQHNVANALSACLAAHIAGVSAEHISETLKSFASLPGRQQVIGEVEGVMFVNDTTATNAEAVKAALRHFGTGGNIMLIAGGQAKGFEYDQLSELMDSQVKHLFLLKGTASEGFRKAAGTHTPVDEYESLKKAFDAATAAAKLGDVVLLSPGAASFGMFKNEFDRGDQYEKLVDEFKASSVKE